MDVYNYWENLNDDTAAADITAEQHVETKHEGIFYICDLCDFKSKWNNYLKRHMEAKHEGVLNTLLICVGLNPCRLVVWGDISLWSLWLQNNSKRKFGRTLKDNIWKSKIETKEKEKTCVKSKEDIFMPSMWL